MNQSDQNSNACVYCGFSPIEEGDDMCEDCFTTNLFGILDAEDVFDCPTESEPPTTIRRCRA